MKPFAKAFLFAIAPLVPSVVAPGTAAARSIDDCEKIEAWDAYNKCLASFGPKRGEVRVAPEGEGPPPARGVRRSGGRHAGSGIVRRGKNGRQFAIFDIGAPTPRARRRR